MMESTGNPKEGPQSSEAELERQAMAELTSIADGLKRDIDSRLEAAKSEMSQALADYQKKKSELEQIGSTHQEVNRIPEDVFNETKNKILKKLKFNY